MVQRSFPFGAIVRPVTKPYKVGIGMTATHLYPGVGLYNWTMQVIDSVGPPSSNEYATGSVLVEECPDQPPVQPISITRRTDESLGRVGVSDTQASVDVTVDRSPVQTTLAVAWGDGVVDYRFVPAVSNCDGVSGVCEGEPETTFSTTLYHTYPRYGFSSAAGLDWDYLAMAYVTQKPRLAAKSVSLHHAC